MEGDREYRRRASCGSSGGLRKDEPMSIQSINPATGEVLETFAPTSRYELDRILAAARTAGRKPCSRCAKRRVRFGGARLTTPVR